ncbi:MAG: sensor histidine kinase [Bacteroidota bacterium]
MARIESIPRFVYHLGFWVLIILLLAYHGSLLGSSFKDNLINMLSLMPVQMLAAYSLIYFLIPRLLYNRRWLLFLLILAVIAYGLSALARLAVIHIAEPLINFESYDESIWEVVTDAGYLIKVYMVSVYLPAVLLFLLKIMKERFQQENKLISLEREKSMAELNFLKAQMNPHFLFNTLNNIYALAKSGSQQTADMVMKLSEILDYTIYECNQRRVPIIKEWELIESYADLQTLRYKDSLMILLDQEIDDTEVEIAPLLLISLVENAFKYVMTTKDSEPLIRINLKLTDKALYFEVFNTKSKVLSSRDSGGKGIGIKNLKRQLSLQYPDRHKMIIEDQKDSYRVELRIDL